MASPEIRIYDALKGTVGEENSKEIIKALDECIVAKIVIMKNDLVTKRDLVAELAEMKADWPVMKADIAELKADVRELKADVAELKADVRELKADVAELKTDFAAMKAGMPDATRKIVREEIQSFMHMVDARIYKSTLIIGITQIITIIGVLFALVKGLL